MSESRTGKRFPLQLPIKIAERKSSKAQDATTLNVSAAGVYIKAEQPFEIGSTVEFDITLPAGVIGTKTDVAIHCRGRVVRTEDKRGGKQAKAKAAGKKSGVACVIDHYKFVRR